MKTKTCSKCGFSMRTGVIALTKGIKWQSAKDEQLKEDDLRGIRDAEFDGQQGQTMLAYKCSNCGYVELFVPS